MSNTGGSTTPGTPPERTGGTGWTRQPRPSRPLWLLVALVWAGACLGPEAQAQSRIPGGKLTGDAEWSGKVRVEGEVEVGPGVTLKIAPGTDIVFVCPAREDGHCGMRILGTLFAAGKAEAPIHFHAEPGGTSFKWSGLRFEAGRGEPSRLEHCRLAQAEAAISGANATLSATDLTIEHNRVGVKAGESFRLALRESRIIDNAVGIEFVRNAEAVVEGSVIAGNGEKGVRCEGGAPQLRKNRISGNAGAGIDCRHGCLATIEDNLVSGHLTGIALDRMSRPQIRHNDIRDNQTGIGLGRLTSPLIEKNLVQRNVTGILCNFSAYPLIRSNHLTENAGFALDLGPKQSFQVSRMGPQEKRERLFSAQGGPLRLRKLDQVSGRSLNIPADGEIDATGNWWGEEVTAEMKRQGGDAEISVIEDYHDQATLEFQGKVYRRDRFDYSPWSPAPIADAGPRHPLP